MAWYLSDGTGPLIEEGEARRVALREAAFNGAVHWRESFKKAKCVGGEVVEGKKCYKIVMTPYEGPPETRYYYKELELLIKAARTRLSSHMGPTPIEVTYSDYRRVDGLLLAHKQKQVSEQCGSTHELLIVTDSIEHNVQLPADRFDPPGEVQALVKAKPRGQLQHGQGGCGGGDKATSQEGTGEPQRARDGSGS